MQLQDKHNQPEEKAKCLPDYNKKSSSIFYKFVLIFSLLPISPFIVIPYLMHLTRKRGKPKQLFHFVESEEVFKKIIDKKILLSLAGGKLHTTNEMNPLLGRKVKCNDKNKVNSFYVFVVNDPGDIDKFEPIINRLRMLHVYKWWKHIRSEYTYRDLNDISFEIEGEVRKKIKSIDGVDCIFHAAHIKKLESLENTLFIQKAQKVGFWLGEIFLTIFLFYFSWLMFILTFNWLCVFGGSLYLFKILFFAKCFVVSFYFPIFVVLLVSLYFILRCGVINSRSK